MMNRNENYPKQFIVSNDEIALFDGWLHEIICGIYLNRSDKLPRTIIFRAEKQVGFILGWFTYNNCFYFKDGDLKIGTDINDTFFQTLSGRFLIIEKIESDIQVTTDPGALLSVIYDENTKIVASTPTVLCNIKKIKIDENVIKNVTRRDGTIWYPFGIVPYEGIKRILPSRKLRLATGKISTINYFEGLKGTESPDLITKEIFDRVTSNIIAVSKVGPLTAHLTAGYDTRMILSSCLSSGVEITFQTFLTDSQSARLDCDIAKYIATTFNLNHKIIIVDKPDEEEVEKWIQRTGHCIYDSVALLCKTVKESDSGNFFLTGGCGEVGRSFYWKKKDLTEKNISIQEVINLLGFATSKYLLCKCENWMDEIPRNLDKTTVLDIAYIDNRLGCWGGPSVYGHNINRPTISPFNEAEIYKKMLSLPKEYRLNNQFAKKFIAFSNDKLLKIPFNRAIGFKKFLHIKQEIKNILPREIYEILKIIYFKTKIKSLRS